MLVLASTLRGQEEIRFTGTQTRAEQAKIETLLEDAETYLNTVPSYLQSQLYAGAEVILLRSQARLAQAESALNAHPEMIQRTFPFIGWPKKLREELTESYREIQGQFLDIEKQAVAVMKDFQMLNPNSELGYRTELIGYFESLLNSIEDPELRAEFEEILERIRGAIENEDLNALEQAFEEAFTFISENEDAVDQPDVSAIPDLPASMENWGGYLEDLKNNIQSIRESNPDLYAKLWAKYNQLVQAVGREDTEAARRIASEIESELESVGAERPMSEIPGGGDDEGPIGRDDEDDDDLMSDLTLPGTIDEAGIPPVAQPYVDFYNDAVDELDELSPDAQAKVIGLLAQLRDAIANGDWSRARSIMQEIQKVFEDEGEDVPEFEASGEMEGGESGLNLERDRDGNLVYVDPVTGETIVFPADLTRPGIAREYIGGRGARLIEEEKQFLEREGDRFELERGESRSWDFQIQEDPNEVDFVDEGMKSVLLIRDQNGQSGFSVNEWKVTLVDTGEVVASASSGTELPLVFETSGSYRVEVRGETDWESPFRIEAILKIDI